MKKIMQRSLSFDSLEARKMLSVDGSNQPDFGDVLADRWQPADANIRPVGELRSGDDDPPQPILPDMFPWADETRGFIYDYVVQGNLLRFTTAFANKGEGDLELIGGDVISSDRRKVTQRVHFTDGSYQDLDAGEFTYHPGHAHIHFDGYAIYKLREKTADGQVGEVVATGGKISFCMVDVIRFDPEAGGSKFGQCESDYQGVTAGWSDVYDRSLPDQWINISGLDDGDYFLEIISDPENQILESDETNNVAIVPVTIQGGPGQSADRFEVNNSFNTAYDLGTVSYRREDGLSIHNNLDVDYFKFTAVESGLMDVRLYFTHELGNLDFQIFNASRKLIRSAVTQSPTEAVQFEVTAEQSYFIQIFSSSSDTNGYSVEVDGPGNVTTVVVASQETPADIPDSRSQGAPGEVLETVVEGPDIILSDLNLLIDDLQHPFVSDLHIELTSPAGTTVTILTSAWEAGGAFLNGQGGFRNTILDDESSTNLYTGELPFSGVYNISGTNGLEHPLSVFNGESARGLWTLRISDWFEQDAGVLNAWSLMFTGEQIDLGDAYEINEDFPHAVDLRSLGFVELHELSIHSGLDRDFFRFNSKSNSPATVSVEFPISAGNLDVTIYDSNLEIVTSGTSIEDNERLQWMAKKDELYYVEVFGVDRAINDYSLMIDLRIPGDFNQDGQVEFADIAQLCSAIRNSGFVEEFDLNHDSLVDRGDMDHLVHQILETSYGDANLDGVFNSTDLTAIFQVGQYEDGIPNNSTWAGGDWNCDGEFDSSDLVLALQDGLYSEAATAAKLAFAAPAPVRSTSELNQLAGAKFATSTTTADRLWQRQASQELAASMHSSTTATDQQATLDKIVVNTGREPLRTSKLAAQATRNTVQIDDFFATLDQNPLARPIL